MSTFKNFVQCRVTTPITAVADSIGLHAAVSPYALPSEEGGLLVLTDSPNNPSKLEVISYTSRSALGLYGVTRGLEGTTAQSWTGPVYCYQSLLAGEFKTLLDSKADIATLGTAATKDVGTSTGNVMQVGAFGLGGANPINNTYDVNDLPAGQRISLTDGITEADAAVQNLPALGGLGTLPRSWHVECTGIGTNRLVQTATEVFGAGTTKGRTFTRVKHDTWYPWQEVYKSNHIVETTGASTTNIMSQKAVTDQLATKANTSTLGTAATKDVGTGTGEVMEVGAFGVGHTFPLAVFDADEIADQVGNKSGFYPYMSDPTSSNIPYAFVLIYQMFFVNDGLSGLLQIAYGVNANTSWIRTRVNDVWSLWVKQVSSIDIGTAAAANITTSNTDGTVGSVLKVGDFGVGGPSVPLEGDIDDFTIPAGLYYAQGSSTGTKPSSSTSGHLYVAQEGTQGLTVRQTWFTGTQNRVFIRNGGTYNNQWSDWQEILHTGNLLQTTGTLTTFPMSQKATTDAIANIPSVPKSASYTVTAADKGKSIDTDSYVLIPASIFEVGDVIVITNTSDTTFGIEGAAGVTVRLAGTASSGVRYLAGYGVATLRMASSNVWFASGAGLS